MPEDVPDDDTDIDGMLGLELQRERLKVQRAIARAALDQRNTVSRIEHSSIKTERYMLALVVGVYGGGVWRVAQDVPDLQGQLVTFVIRALQWLG